MPHVEHLDKEGISIPSVSQIPGIFAKDMSGFEDWICRNLHGKEDPCCVNARRKFYQESADLGNDVHSLMEAFLKGETFEDGVPDYQAAVFDPVAQFFKESGYKPVHIEQKMTGKEFGGTLDTSGTFANPFWEKQRKTFWDGKHNPGEGPTKDTVWVVDLKIKSKLDPLHPLQLYGYSLLLKEVYGIEANWGLIIRREKNLDKTPQIQLKGYYLPDYSAQWDASMLMYHFLND
jgi:hypothetical protein